MLLKYVPLYLFSTGFTNQLIFYTLTIFGILKQLRMSWFLGTIYVLNSITIITILFVERKKTSTALSWILILTFIPVLGFIFYPILGRNLRPNQKRTFALKKKLDILYNERLHKENYLLKYDNKNYIDKELIPYEDIIKMNSNGANSYYSSDNDIQIYTKGEDKFKSLLEDIRAAKETINILYYIINNDKLGNKVVDLLTKKASEGVEVRVLYDHVGSILTPHKMFKNLIKCGGEVYRFSPIKIGTYTRVNYRNHRKIVIIDGKIAYTGGMNIGDEYLGLDNRIKPWRDTHLRITGTSVYTLQERFLMDWSYASDSERETDIDTLNKFFPKVKCKGSIGAQVISSGPDVNGDHIKKAYIKMIASAKKTIYIQTPYFIPDDSFIEALQIAILSGVDVKIMLPKIYDKLLVYRATTSYIKDILQYGGEVYLYPGFLHSKMLVIDGKVASIGTANMDVRSFSYNFEVNTFIYDNELAYKCNQIFEEDRKISEFVTKEVYDKRKLYIKLQENLCRLFSPML